MKECLYCGAKIQDQAIVCGYCGRDLVKTLPLATDSTREKARQRIAAIGFVIAALFVITSLLVFGFFLWNSF